MSDIVYKYSKDNKIKISFICCVFNEIKIAPKELRKLLNVIAKRNIGSITEVLIIDNNSNDGTKKWIDSIQDKSIRKFINKENIGKGGSIKRGIKMSRGKIGIIYDLDGEYNAEDSIIGIDLLEKTKAVICLGSRLLKDKPKFIYILNLIGVIMLTKIINIIYNVNLTDAATGLKIIDNNFFKKNMPLFNGFNVDFELICLALNKNKLIVEFPGVYLPRSIEQGKKLKAIPDGFSSLFSIIFTSLKKS